MNIERIATVVLGLEGAVMVMATQSAVDTELAGRFGRGAGDTSSTHDALAASQRDHLKPSFLLFDEIEKASNECCYLSC